MIGQGQIVQLHAHPLPCAFNRASVNRHAINSGFFLGFFMAFLFAMTIHLNESGAKKPTKIAWRNREKPSLGDDSVD